MWPCKLLEENKLSEPCWSPLGLGFSFKDLENYPKTLCNVSFQPFMFSFSLGTGLTPSTWRHLLPVGMIMWQCMMDRTPWRLCLGNSVVQCSHLICAPPPTNCLSSSGQMPQWMGLAGGLLTVKHSVGQCYAVCDAHWRWNSYFHFIETHAYTKACTKLKKISCDHLFVVVWLNIDLLT